MRIQWPSPQGRSWALTDPATPNDLRLHSVGAMPQLGDTAPAAADCTFSCVGRLATRSFRGAASMRPRSEFPALVACWQVTLACRAAFFPHRCHGAAHKHAQTSPGENLFYFDSSYRPIPLDTTFIGVTEAGTSRSRIVSRLARFRPLATPQRPTNLVCPFHSFQPYPG